MLKIGVVAVVIKNFKDKKMDKEYRVIGTIEKDGKLEHLDILTASYKKTLNKYKWLVYRVIEIKRLRDDKQTTNL